MDLDEAILGSPTSGPLILEGDADATESMSAYGDMPDVGTPDEPNIGGTDETSIGPSDAAPVGTPDRDDPEVAGRKAFRAWWDANARFVDDDAELIALLEWRAKVHLDVARRLYAERLALLIAWRSGGLTLQQIAQRSGLSYARVYELMPKHLRGRRRPQDQGTDTADIGGADTPTIGGPDSEPVAA